MNILDVLKDEKLIYNLFEDEISRKIFQYRCLYSITGDYSNIFNMLHLVPEVCKVIEHLEKVSANNANLFIYGAGERSYFFAT